MIKPVGLDALSDLKLVADGPLRFRAIHIWCTMMLFRCVRQERISIRGSVRPSVRPSVCLLRKCKNRVSRLFLATVRSTNMFESLLHYSVVSSVCSIHAETQSGRIAALSVLFLTQLIAQIHSPDELT